MTYSIQPPSQDTSSLDDIQLALYKNFSSTPETPLVIAYSGGVDSQVILHACYVLKSLQLLSNSITVCHVNHGLSPHANLWENNAKQQCLEYYFSLVVKRVEVKNISQKSLEALARDARYKALSEHSENNAKIVTGHHGDDQVETFFLALKRGSGLKGLSAMKETLPLNIEAAKSQSLVRPLLRVSRHDILAYAKKYELTWVEDESNSDTRFERNFLRHDVIPTLKKRWPSFLTTLFRSTEHIQESQQLLDELAAQDLQSCMSVNNRLSTTHLLALSQARFNNLLRFYLAKKHYLMPSTEQLVQAYQQMLDTEGQSAEVKLGEVWLRVFKTEVYFTALLADLTRWQSEVILQKIEDSREISQITLPENLGTLYINQSMNDESVMPYEDIAVKQHFIQPPNKGQKVEVKFSHHNPTCLPDYRNKSRSLKKVLQELSIPPWERKQVPFLYYDGELVAAIGYFVCKSFIPDNKDTAWVISQVITPKALQSL